MMARILYTLLSAGLLLIAGANAQFQFFEQMFQGGQQQQRQQPQNVPSDSNWYQEHYNNGLFLPLFPLS
jgi:hypothetical protein